MVTRAEITVDKLLSDLAEDRELARSIKQPGAAIQATQLMGKLVGLMVDRKETGVPGEFAALASRDAVLAAIRAELGDEAADMLNAATLARQPLPGPREAVLLELVADRSRDDPAN